MLKARHEDLPVPDFTRARRVCDGFNSPCRKVFRDSDVDAKLGYEMDLILGPLIYSGMTLLAPVHLDLGNGHSRDACIGKGAPDVIELEWLYDCSDELHLLVPAKE